MAIEARLKTGLLKTKYTIPESNQQLIPRPLLNVKLADALNCKLTLVTAPAGYGKTTAVLKWLEDLPLLSTWLSADTHNNSPTLFWRYFCAALDSILDGISKDTEYVFTSPELLNANIHLNILIDRLSGIKQDTIFVLDDLHLITNQEIIDAMSFFISYLPSNIHLILISRIEPRMKLAKLVLKEDLLRLRAKDLRFSTEEIEQYFKTRGYYLEKENIQKIESYTEGWAAALVAVALSFKHEQHRNSVINSFGSCNLHIENYLVEDVMSTWTEEQWEFMQETSICDQLCGPLCEAVSGHHGSRLLKELYGQNSFLNALDEEHTWFRFHHLFLDFLRKRLRKKDNSFIKDLHCRAGDWFMENDFCEEAIAHFLQGGYYETAIALMEKLFFPMIFQGIYSKGISWLQIVPDRYKENSSPAMFFEMYYYASIENFEKALEFVQKAEHFIKINASASDSLQLQYILAKINIFYRQGDIKSVLQLLRHLPPLNPIDITSSYVDFNLHDISCFRTKLKVFAKLFKEDTAKFYSATGNFSALFRTMAGYEPLVVGEFHYESGNPEKALPQLAAAIDEAVNASCPGALVPAMVTLAKIKRAHGDMSGAIEIIEECENRVAEFHKPHWGYLLRAFKVRLHLDMGNIEAADSWMKGSRLGIYQEITAAREYELIVLARVLIRKHRYNDANILLNRLLNFAEGKKRVHSVVEITILLAVTAMKNLNDEAAAEYIGKALSIGIEEGYVSSFADELTPMVSLLEMYTDKYKKSVKLAAYSKKLLNFTRESLRRSLLSTGLEATIHLTPTEQKVLNLIIDAFSNQEIADKLEITMSTVKAHTGSIYKKLGVKNRAQCIKKSAMMFKF